MADACECAIISAVSNVCLIDGPLFPGSGNNKCLAIIFAVKRTASVPGQIRFLSVSIITINGINIVCSGSVKCGEFLD